MTIEVALLISGVSLAFGIYQGVCNLRRNNKCDDNEGCHTIDHSNCEA